MFPVLSKKRVLTVDPVYPDPDAIIGGAGTSYYYWTDLKPDDLFTDAAGTTPVSAPGDPVRAIFLRGYLDSVTYGRLAPISDTSKPAYWGVDAAGKNYLYTTVVSTLVHFNPGTPEGDYLPWNSGWTKLVYAVDFSAYTFGQGHNNYTILWGGRSPGNSTTGLASGIVASDGALYHYENDTRLTGPLSWAAGKHLILASDALGRYRDDVLLDAQNVGARNSLGSQRFYRDIMPGQRVYGFALHRGFDDNYNSASLTAMRAWCRSIAGIPQPPA